MSPIASSYRTQRVLITGGLGFIGSAIARALLSSGARVRVLDSMLPQGGGRPRNLANSKGDLEVIVEDVRNRDAVQRSVEGVDVIFHLAGPSGPSALPGDWYAQLDIACLGTLNLLEAARTSAPSARIVFASSYYVYALPSPNAVSEDAPTDPSTLFGVHKLAGEKYFGVFRQSYGLDVVVARLTNVFGPRQRLRGGSRGSFTQMLDAALHGEDIRLTNPNDRHDFIYVEDAVKVLTGLGAVPTMDHHVYNVGSGVGVQLQSVAELIVSSVGRGAVREIEPPDRIANAAPKDFVVDVSRLSKVMGPAKRRDLADAIQSTTNWYQGSEGVS